MMSDMDKEDLLIAMGTRMKDRGLQTSNLAMQNLSILMNQFTLFQISTNRKF
jgi:hypothetical protein